MASPGPERGPSSPDTPTLTEEHRRRNITVEELCFTSAMNLLEAYFQHDPAVGPRTMPYITKFITKTLEKTHSLKEVR